jgi:hypothetical protein
VPRTEFGRLSGELVVGPVHIEWGIEPGVGIGRHRAVSEFQSVGTDQVESIVVVPGVRPMTATLRRGIEIRFDGTPVRVTRNGRKLRLRNRQIRIISPDERINWLARGGSAPGAVEIVDCDRARPIWRSNGLDSAIVHSVSPNETVLLVALALNNIPQSMSLRFARF